MTDRHPDLADDPQPHKSWWRVEHNTAPLPSQRQPRPGSVTDTQDEQLASLRRRVVEPVVYATLRPNDLRAVDDPAVMPTIAQTQANASPSPRFTANVRR